MPPNDEPSFLNRGANPHHDLAAAETTEASSLTFGLTEATATPRIGDAESPRSSLEAGRLFGGYHLLRLLGRGGFAEVWEAEHLADGRRLALKVLEEVRGISESARARFEREGRLAASLSHPRTVYVFAAEMIESRPTIAMELVAGGSLQDRLDASGPLPARDAVDAILDVIEGLEAAQRLGIVHRDIKPSNCFVEDAGRVKIGDFGISKSLELDAKLTETGTFLGTPVYASPEQIRGEPADVRSDRYSLGATLYALLAAAHPFGAKGGGQLLASILTEKPVPLEQRGIIVPRPLSAVVRRLLSKDPGRRYPSYSALKADLLPLSSRGFMAPRPEARFAAWIVDMMLATGPILALLCVNALKGMDLSGAHLMRRISERLIAGGFAELNAGLRPQVVGFVLLCQVAAFTLLEWIWQTTPGKALMGLRVIRTDGTRISFIRAAGRSLTFWVSQMPQYLPGSWGALGLLLAPLPVVTMRRANGYAGLHEVTTGTRVVSLKRFLRYRASIPEAGDRLKPEVVLPPNSEYRGPYRIVDQVWRTESERLVVGADDLLARRVWIHETFGDPTPPRARYPERPTRLRWLQSGQSADTCWAAFEAPPGSSLAQRIERSGPVPWPEFREILLQLLSEIRTSLSCGELPGDLSIDHIWFDDFGNLRLLEFPSSGGDSARRDDLEVNEWPALVRQVLALGIEGRRLGRENRDLRSSPRVPLPQSARRFIEKLLDAPEKPTQLDAFIVDLKDLRNRPASITRAQRAIQLLGSNSLQILLIALWASVFLAQAKEGVPLIECLLRWTGVTALLFGILAIPATLLALVFRGGPILRLLGINVVDEQGAPATRENCLARSLVAWSPVLVAWGLLSGSGELHRLGATLPGGTLGNLQGRHHLPLEFGLAFFLVLIFLTGCVWSILSPSRGLQDRISGTRLVPK